MKNTIIDFMYSDRRNRRLNVLKEERGQVLPLVAIMMVGLLGTAGFVTDVGRVYLAHSELQQSADAAALAGAYGLASNTAVSTATTYSSSAGNANAYGGLNGVTIQTSQKCLTTLTSAGIACVSPTNANAIVVREQVAVPMYFAALFGTSSVTVSASATASMRGAITTPYNVAIIIDSTGSMSTVDSDCGNATRLQCALNGVQVLLQGLSPCSASLSTCGTATGGNVANSVDRVSLFTFPNITVGTASQEYDCSATNPTIPVYSLPPSNGTTYAPSGSSTATYQITPFQSDYRTSDTTSSLNTSSNVALAVNAKSGCTGITNPGGDGTYYAGVIYAAQAALTAEAAANPGSQNVIIMLSDGDATATSSRMATTTTDGKTAINSNGTYPSYNGQCNQAVTAAGVAAAAGTKVYSVAYGSASSGCATDVSYGTYKGITPCQTMEKIASSPAYFFSDYNQSGSGSTCQSASQPTTNISQIFGQILTDFTTPRLIPDNTP